MSRRVVSGSQIKVLVSVFDVHEKGGVMGDVNLNQFHTRSVDCCIKGDYIAKNVMGEWQLTVPGYRVLVRHFRDFHDDHLGIEEDVIGRAR